jgi:predicted small lipoprotein YifL
MRRPILLTSLCFAAIVLAGCGQKGPLFMPPPTKGAPAPASTVVRPAPVAVPNTIVPDNQKPDSDGY